MERSFAKSFTDLDVFKSAMEAAMEIFELSKGFPSEERYSMTDQIRKASRSVCANLGESWRRRRYSKAFISKLNECESEAAETHVWLMLALRCEYISAETENRLVTAYDRILGQLVNMINNADRWTLS